VQTKEFATVNNSKRATSAIIYFTNFHTSITSFPQIQQNPAPLVLNLLSLRLSADATMLTSEQALEIVKNHILKKNIVYKVVGVKAIRGNWPCTSEKTRINEE
jgi:hypothetical protein